MNAELKNRKPKAGLLLIASPRFKNLYGPKRGTYGDRKNEADKGIKATMDFLDLVDPGIVYEKIIVDFGGYQKSHLFMNESPCYREK